MEYLEIYWNCFDFNINSMDLHAVVLSHAWIYKSKLYLMNFSKIWKATALAASVIIPVATYSLKSK